MLETQKILFESIDEKDVNQILTKVIDGMQNNGYDAIQQLAGYILTGDPVYITSKDSCRDEISKIDRNDLLEHLLRLYVDCKAE